MTDRRATRGRKAGSRHRWATGLRACTALGAAALTTGCATIGAGPSAHADTVLGVAEIERADVADTVSVEQSGVMLQVRAHALCVVEESKQVSRVTTTERKNQSAWLDWLLLGGGVAAAGGGTAILIDSSNVHATDETGRTYNPVGNGTATAVGIGLIAVGAAALVVPAVDAVRAGKTDEKTEHLAVGGHELRRATPCKTPIPRPGVDLALRVDGQSIPLGKTDEAGLLRVDLDRVMAPDAKLQRNAKAHVMRGDKEIDRVDLASLVKAREESAWSRIDRGACATPQASNACDPVELFIKGYPDGAHATEARLLLEKARPALAVATEREVWSATNVDGCARPAGRDVVGAELLCQELQRYVESFPSGKHVAEAKAALAKGLPLIKQFQDAERRREREDELAQKRREQQEAEKEKAALRTQCNAKCNVMCSRRANPAMCLSGCIQLCVTQGGN